MYLQSAIISRSIRVQDEDDDLLDDEDELDTPSGEDGEDEEDEDDLEDEDEEEETWQVRPGARVPVSDLDFRNGSS
jgi:hypothetical protein